MLPGIGLEYSDLTGLPPDLAALSDKELARRLQNDPQLRNNEDVMADVADRIDAYDPDDASADASQLAEGDTETACKLALLNVYAEYAQEHDKTIPLNAATYLRNIVGALFPGDDNSYRHTLPEATATQEALDDASIGNWTTGMLANSLLLASDGRLDPTPHHGPARPILGSSAVPKAVTDALHDTPSPSFGRSPIGHMSGGDGFRDLASLLADSDEQIEAGQAFSRDLTDTTASLINDARTWREEGYDTGSLTKSVNDDSIDRVMGEHIPAMQHMVDVATRNEQANTWFLHDAAENNGEAAQHLADLYTFDWEDNGDAVSGYTDWIHDALDPRNEGEPDTADRWEMAQRASVDVIDAVTDTGNDGEGPNVFRQLMGGGQEDAKSFGIINPQIADSLGDVGARNLDALGANAATGKTQIGPDGGVEVAEDDRGRLFTLVNTDPDAAKDLNTQVGVYQAEQLRDAIKSGDDDALKAAAENNGNLEGYMNAGRVNANLIGDRLGYEVDLNEYEDARKAADLAKGFALTG